MKTILIAAAIVAASAFATDASAQMPQGGMGASPQGGRGAGTLSPSSTPTNTLSPNTRTNGSMTAPAMDNRTPTMGTSPEINRSNMTNSPLDRSLAIPPTVPTTPAMPGSNPAAPVGTPAGTYSNPTGGGQNSNTGDGTNLR